MHCFKHIEADAVGICKACNKAVCSSCAIDTGRGLACSEVCVKEVKEINEIVDRSKQIYSISSSSRLPPTGIIMFAFFGVMFTAWGIYNSTIRDRVDYFTIVMGLGFIAVTFIAYIRNKKLRMNC